MSLNDCIYQMGSNDPLKPVCTRVGCKHNPCPFGSKERARNECDCYFPVSLNFDPRITVTGTAHTFRDDFFTGKESLYHQDAVDAFLYAIKHGNMKEIGTVHKVYLDDLGAKIEVNTPHTKKELEDMALDNKKNMQHDPVNHPSHYTAGGIECIDAIAAALTSQNDPMAAWLTGQCLKYLWRWPMKNGLEDLKKTRFYLDRLIKYIEED